MTSREVRGAELNMELDETQYGTIYATCARLFSVVKTMLYRAKILSQTGVSQLAEDRDVSEVEDHEILMDNSVLSTQRRRLQRRRRSSSTYNPNWYQEQKKLYREPDYRGEHWIWTSGGDCPA